MGPGRSRGFARGLFSFRFDTRPIGEKVVITGPWCRGSGIGGSLGPQTRSVAFMGPVQMKEVER